MTNNLTRKKSSRLVIAVLLLAGVTMSYTITSVAINDLIQVFPGLTKLGIDVYSALPNIMIVLFAVVFGFASKAMTKKAVSIIGSLMYLIGGIAPAIWPNIIVLFASRMVMGAGIGLLTPLMTSMVSDFFEGYKRAKIMGYTSAAANTGTLVVSVIAGVVCLINWRYIYWVFALLGIPAVISAVFMIPKYKLAKVAKKKFKLNKNIIKPIVHVSLFMGLMYAFILNISFVVDEKGIGGSDFVGMLLMMLSVAGLAGGLIFGKIDALVGKYKYMLNYILCAVALIAMAVSVSKAVFIAASSLVGLSIAIAIPSSLVEISKHGDPQDVEMGMGLMVAVYNASMFILPLIINVGMNAFSLTTGVQAFYTNATILIVCASAAFVLAIREKI